MAMTTRSRLQCAKRALLEDVSHLSWFVSAGIGRVDDERGIVVSIQPGSRARARRRIRELELRVPLALREVKDVRARSARRQPSKRRRSAATLTALRKAARRRSS
jgi:hypothetical protein